MEGFGEIILDDQYFMYIQHTSVPEIILNDCQ